MFPVKSLRTFRLPTLKKYVASRCFSNTTLSKGWQTKQIVPDVIDEVPPRRLVVKYPEVTITEGNFVKPEQVKDPPQVLWKITEKGCFFTLCMTDPDAPSRTKPTLREWHHWLVVNIPNNEVENGETLTEYVGAGPPKVTGLHRYVLLLYHQPEKINFSEKKISNKSAQGREKFSIRKFAEKYKLGKPYAGNFFEAEYDDYVPVLMKQLGIIK